MKRSDIMKTSLLNLTLPRRGFFGAAMAVALLGVILNAQAITGWFVGTYHATLKFPRSVVDSCQLLNAGDTAEIAVQTGILGAEYRYFTKQKSNLGTGSFTGVTTAGVPVAGQAKIVGNYDSATITITDLIIGDPNGDYCLLTGLNIKVNVIH